MYIEDNVTIRSSTIGPNVSIGSGSVIEGSTLTDTIIGADSTITNAKLASSLVGDSATVDGVSGHVNVSDHSVVKIGE